MWYGMFFTPDRQAGRDILPLNPAWVFLVLDSDPRQADASLVIVTHLRVDRGCTRLLFTYSQPPPPLSPTTEPSPNRRPAPRSREFEPRIFVGWGWMVRGRGVWCGGM